MMQTTLPRWFNDCIGCHILANKNLQPGNESEFGGGGGESRVRMTQ